MRLAVGLLLWLLCGALPVVPVMRAAYRDIAGDRSYATVMGLACLALGPIALVCVTAYALLRLALPHVVPEVAAADRRAALDEREARVAEQERRIAQQRRDIDRIARDAGLARIDWPST